MNFEVIIPTYKRKNDLSSCLDSISEQSLLPERIIIIDDDKLPEEFTHYWQSQLGKRGVKLVHYIKDHDYEPRGSNESRNKGMELANEDVVFIFDDDIILKDNFFASVMRVWNESGDEALIGVGGVIVNNRKRFTLERLYNKIFGLGSDLSWDVNAVGFQDWDDWISTREKGHYIHGGACSFSRSATLDIGGFPIFEGGRGGLVDPDFCLKAKQAGYHFIIEPKAKVIHNHSPSGREHSSLTGFKEGYNRKRIFKKYCPQTFMHCLWFIWANIGWVLRQFLTGKFAKGVGMIKGLLTP